MYLNIPITNLDLLVLLIYNLCTYMFRDLDTYMPKGPTQLHLGHMYINSILND